MGKVATGVKVLAVLYYIGAVLLALAGIASLFGAGALVKTIPLLAMFGGLITVAAIAMILLAVLYFFVGRGLWKGQKWAMIVAIIFAAIGVISGILGIIGGDIGGSIIGLIINGVIIWYLGFNKAGKASFA
jgi:hypothetical protein